MSRYEEMLLKMEKIGEDERIALLNRNRGLCICPKCPTYYNCIKENLERLYCWTGKSLCGGDPAGCLCPTCPVAAPMGYSPTYYCTGGLERELRR